jgi:glycosyltransferase involved in cell wall biosynthesis
VTAAALHPWLACRAPLGRNHICNHLSPIPTHMVNQPRRPRLTIGMPIYNAAGLLASAFDSLLAQTFTDFEIIVSDNASTDDTEALCRDYATRDKRIRYVRQAINHGSTWNFSETFRLSDSEYFKWASYDDLCAPVLLEKCVEVLEQHADVAWVHSRSQHIDITGELLLGEKTPEVSYVESHDSQPLPTRASSRPSDRFRAVLLGRGGCLDSYGLIRSSALRKTQLFLPCFGSEKVLMAELGLWGRYFEIPETLFFARIHPAALGSQKTSRLQRKAINPLARGHQFPRLRLLFGYWNAIRRSQIRSTERLRCYSAIARYLFQFHKWNSVIQKAIRGRGLSGEYPALPRVQQHPNGALRAT